MKRLLVACSLAAACGGPPPEPSKWGSPVGFVDEAICPVPEVVEGVDVSEYQGNIDWNAYKGSGRGFAITRVSDGTGHFDPTFDANWNGMKSVGLVRGVYQFWEPGEDPTAQANLLVQHVGKLGPGDLPAVADVEVAGGVSPSTLVANLKVWLDVVQSGTGKTPMIYTSPGLWSSIAGGSTAFGAYPLWVANWGVSCPSLPSGWNAFKVWQYADNGTGVAGINATVDLDRFNGSAADLATFANGTPPAYAATFVMQSWPYATTTMQVTTGQVIKAKIIMKNTGTATWDSSTHLATTQPRDRNSPFADSTWIAPNRLAGLAANVPPGQNGEFDFEWRAPSAPGMYDEFYGFVEDGKAWFSDPGQGGPPDNQIEAKFQVSQAQYAGELVSSSFSSPVTAPCCGSATVDGFFELKNTGTQTWKAGETKLAPTPRDMASPFADPSWLSPTRVSTVAADVPPGGVGHFDCKLAPGTKIGTFMLTFTLVEDGVTWFADGPKGGGPADDGLKVTLNVVGDDMGGMGGEDGGGVDGGHPLPKAVSGGCGCRVGAHAPAPLAPLALVAGSLLVVATRRARSLRRARSRASSSGAA